MNVSLVTILLQLMLIGIIYAKLYKFPLYKTKRPRYIMRGRLVAPQKPPDYCQSGLCPPGVEHLACNKPFWSQECAKPRQGIESNLYWMIALSVHNMWRLRVSRQSISDLPRARFLPPLRWSNELAEMAMRITNYCNDVETTKCVNTPHFLHISRNSAVFLNEYELGLDIVWREVINFLWLNYVWKVDKKVIESYPQNPTLEQEQMANILLQETTHMGCGILVRMDGTVLKFFLTCTYNNSPKSGEPIYEIYNKTNE